MDVNSLAGPYEYANSLAGLDGYDTSSNEAAIAALAALDGDELGRRHRAQRAQQMGRIPTVGVQQMPLANIRPPINGAPARGLRKVPLPLGSVAWGVGLTTTNEAVLTARTQRPYKGVRLIFTTSRVGATSGGLLTIEEIKVGQDPQPAADGSMPLDAFGPSVWDMDLDLTPLAPGIEIKVRVKTTIVPGGTDRIDIAGMFVGYAVQS